MFCSLRICSACSIRMCSFVSLVYLNGFTWINFISGSLFLGADHFPLVLYGLVVLAIFLEENSSALCPLPPQLQQVVFTTKPESWMVSGEFQDPFSTIWYRLVPQYANIFGIVTIFNKNCIHHGLESSIRCIHQNIAKYIDRMIINVMTNFLSYHQKSSVSSLY